MVSFSLTQTIRDCIIWVDSRSKDGGDLLTSQKNLMQKLSSLSLGEEITLNEVNNLAETARKLAGNVEKSTKKAKNEPHFWVHELLEGAEIFVTKKPEYSNDQEKKVAEEKDRRKKEIEKREYEKMTANIQKKEVFPALKEIKTTNKYISLIIQMGLSVFACFVTGCWAFGRAYDSTFAGVMGGLGMALFIAFVEFWLFFIREKKKEIYERDYVDPKTRKKFKPVATYSTADSPKGEENQVVSKKSGKSKKKD